MNVDKLTSHYYDTSGNKEFYKGTSFRIFVGKEGMTYYNNEQYVDGVMHKGGLCVCKETHVATADSQPSNFYLGATDVIRAYDSEVNIPIAMADNPYWNFVGGAYHAGFNPESVDATKITFEYDEGESSTYSLKRSGGSTSKTVRVKLSNDWGQTGKNVGEFQTGNNIKAYTDDDNLILDIDGSETVVDVSKTDVKMDGNTLSVSKDRGQSWKPVGKFMTEVTTGNVSVTSVDADSNAQVDVNVADGNKLNFKFSIPKGAVGEKGDKGDVGPQGAQGIQGANGEGTQTIYCLASSTPSNPTPDDGNDKSSEYQTNDRYLPLGNGSFDSLKPESREEYSYKCSRTKDTNGKWSRYTDPDRYAFYAIVNDFVDLHASFTAFAFCRVPNDIDLAALGVVPYGGINEPNGDFGPGPCDTYVEGLEDPIKGHDTIPEGDGTIGFTTHVFSSDKIYTDVNCSDGSDVKWSIPIKAGDSLNIEFEFSKGDAEGKFVAPKPLQQYYDADKINYEKLFHEDNHEGYDEDGLFGGSVPDGDDNKSVSDAKGMAMSTFKNGVWSEGKVVQIKGEDGSDGQLLNIRGKINESDVENLPCDSTEYKPGDAYQVYDENNTRILYHMVFTGDDSTESGSNEKCGYKLETSGEASYIHIKYAEIPGSSDIDLTPVSDEEYEKGITNPNLRDNQYWIGFTYDLGGTIGEPVGRYIGVYADNEEDDSLSPGKYKGSKFEGQDGGGYEYIYALSPKIGADSSGDATIKGLMDNSEYKDDNYITSNDNGRTICGLTWFDDPQQISVNNPYCYVSQRRKDPLNGWQAFTYPVLWSTINDLKRGYDIMTLYFASTDDTIDDGGGQDNYLSRYIYVTKKGDKIYNPDQFTSLQLSELSKHNFDKGWQTIKPESYDERETNGNVIHYSVDSYYIGFTTIIYDPSNQKGGTWSEPKIIKTPNSEFNTPTIIIPITLYSNSFTNLSVAKEHLPYSYVLGVDDINDNLKWFTDSEYNTQVEYPPNYSIINEENEGEDGGREQIGFKIHEDGSLNVYKWYFMRPKFEKGKIITKISANLILNSTNYIAPEKIGEINYEIYSKRFTGIDIVDDTTDTDKLVNAFGEVNESAVYLSQLMGVKNGDDTSSNVVAGIYGGGNDDYNSKTGVVLNAGTSNASKLMMFAGSTDINSIGSAAFRVYDNGDTYVNNLVASGYLSSKRYGSIEHVGNTLNSYVVDIDSDIKTYVLNTTQTSVDITVKHPILQQGRESVGSVEGLTENIEEILPFVGNKYCIYINNTLGNATTVTGNFPTINGDDKFEMVKVTPLDSDMRYLMIVEYKIDLYSSSTNRYTIGVDHMLI